VLSVSYQDCILGGVSVNNGEIPVKNKNNKRTDSPKKLFSRTFRLHVYASLPFLVLYMGLLVYLGFSKNWKIHPYAYLMSIWALAGSLYLFNGLFKGIRSGQFLAKGFKGGGSGDCHLAESPVAFFIHVIIRAAWALGFYVFSVFILTQ